MWASLCTQNAYHPCFFKSHFVYARNNKYSRLNPFSRCSVCWRNHHFPVSKMHNEPLLFVCTMHVVQNIFKTIPTLLCSQKLLVSTSFFSNFFTSRTVPTSIVLQHLKEGRMLSAWSLDCNNNCFIRYTQCMTDIIWEGNGKTYIRVKNKISENNNSRKGS